MVLTGTSNQFGTNNVTTCNTGDESPKCRAQCGFFAASAHLGYCSQCYSGIKDDFYLTAVIGANIGDVIPVTQFLSVGGSVRRKLTEEEAKQLNKLAIFVPHGSNLVDVAANRDNAELIAMLVSTMEEEDTAGLGPMGRRTPPIASRPISKLLISPKPAGVLSQGASAGTSPIPQFLDGLPPAMALTLEEEADEQRQEAEADNLLENVRLEILSTFDTREDGLIHFWTAHPLHYNTTSTNSANAEARTSINSGDSSDAEERAKRQRPASADSAQCPQPQAQQRTQIIGRSFALPERLQSIPWQERQEAMACFLEQPTMQDDIHLAIDFFPLVPGCTEFVPLYTAADLNCLLHGCFTSMAAVRDDVLASEDPNASTVETRTMLRDAVYNSLTQCSPLQHILVNGSESRLMELLKDASKKASLDGGHVFALANVLRRPIIVYAHQKLEGGHRESLTAPFRVSGIYLPLMWEPTTENSSSDGGSSTTPSPPSFSSTAGTVRDPIVLCYSQGHFSSLVGFTSPELVEGEQNSQQDPYVRLSVPLCDETLGPLPIHFSRASPQYTSTVSAVPLPEGLTVSDSEGTMSMVDPPPADCGVGEAGGQGAQSQAPSVFKKRRGHNPMEMALLRHYLRGVSVQPLGDGESDEDLLVTTCEQLHLPRGPLGLSTLLSHTQPAANEDAVTETNWWTYTSALWERIDERLEETAAKATEAAQQSSPPALLN